LTLLWIHTKCHFMQKLLTSAQ